MALLPPEPIHLLVRWVHVVGVAGLLGGALLAWIVLEREGDGAAGLQVAAAYEWLFWGAAGLVVLAGVGNLGAIAPALPRLGSPWGLVLAAKLAGVVVLLLGSLVRTFGVVGCCRESADPVGPSDLARLRAGYLATAVLLLLLVALGEVLAHG